MIDLSKVDGLHKRLPASEDEIRNVEKEMEVLFPEAFKELLSQTNGFTTDGVVVIYGTEEISERNETLEVEEYAKGYIAIGDDSGPTVFLLSLDNAKREVLGVDCGDMNPLNAEVVDPNLLQWLANGCYCD